RGHLGDVHDKAAPLDIFLAQAGANGVRARFAGGGTQHHEPGLAQRQRDGLADTAAGAGDQCNLLVSHQDTSFPVSACSNAAAVSSASTCMSRSTRFASPASTLPGPHS